MIKVSLFIGISFSLLSCSNFGGTEPKADSVIPPKIFDPESCRDTIARLETQRSRFIIHGQGDSLLNMYTDDAQILAQYQTIYSGKTSIVTYWSSQHIYSQYDRTIVSLKGNENLLYETGIEAMKGTDRAGDQQYAGSDKYLVIWKRTKDGWKIASEMWNELPLPPKMDMGD